MRRWRHTIEAEHDFGTPVEMCNNVLVQLSQVISLVLTKWVTLFVNNLTPRTHQLNGQLWHDFFVPSINTTAHGFKAVSDVLLGGLNIRVHGPTKTTLVSDNKIPKHISNIVVGEIGPHLMMHKIGMARRNKLTPDIFHNFNVTNDIAYRVIITRSSRAAEG
jgi:hypothetical protein